MKILLTGGAGYVGSACLRWLLGHGHDPIAYDDLSEGNRAAVPDAAGRLIEGDIADTDRALSRQLVELLELIRQYGPEPVADAIAKASAARAFGADYIANILRQQQSPRNAQPPLRLRDPLLNDLVTDPLSLLEYDAFILDPGKESDDDSSRREAESTEPVDHEPPPGDDSD